jgi:predicted ATPase
MRELVRAVDRPFVLTAFLHSDEAWLEYTIELTADPRSSSSVITAERVTRYVDPARQHRAWHAFTRVGRAGLWRGPLDGTEPKQSVDFGLEQSALQLMGSFGPPEAGAVQKVLHSLEVFPPLEVGPLWAQRHELGVVRTARTPSQVVPATQLSRDGTNLASAFLELMGSGPETANRVLHDVRAGLGLDVTHVAAVPSSMGALQLKVRFGVRDVPASQLSQGQLNYLALVAIKHLDSASAAVVFDEPELHLHPGLLVRAAWLLSDIAKGRPVIVGTHADAFLDALDEPEKLVRVLTLGAQRQTLINRIDTEEFTKWRETYSTISELRRGGLLEEVLEAAAP